MVEAASTAIYTALRAWLSAKNADLIYKGKVFWAFWAIQTIITLHQLIISAFS